MNRAYPPTTKPQKMQRNNQHRVGFRKAGNGIGIHEATQRKINKKKMQMYESYECVRFNNQKKETRRHLI